jgi:hypothetical protein
MVCIFQLFHQSSAAKARKRDRTGGSRNLHINNEAKHERKRIV